MSSGRARGRAHMAPSRLCHPSATLTSSCTASVLQIETITGQYRGCVGQEAPYDYGARVIGQIKEWLGRDAGPGDPAPLKTFTSGETPAPGEVG